MLIPYRPRLGEEIGIEAALIVGLATLRAVTSRTIDEVFPMWSTSKRKRHLREAKLYLTEIRPASKAGPAAYRADPRALEAAGFEPFQGPHLAPQPFEGPHLAPQAISRATFGPSNEAAHHIKHPYPSGMYVNAHARTREGEDLPPSWENVEAYAKAEGIPSRLARTFFEHYASESWKLFKRSGHVLEVGDWDWRAKLRRWMLDERNRPATGKELGAAKGSKRGLYGKPSLSGNLGQSRGRLTRAEALEIKNRHGNHTSLEDLFHIIREDGTVYFEPKA